jgi:predicted nucleic acid-binding protein
MSAVLIDSSVLLDILGGSAEWWSWSSDALARASDSAPLIINPIIYAEVSIRYSFIEDVDNVLPREMFARESIPYAAAFLAGKAFLAYRRRGGLRTAPLPDFFIGAHAAIAGYQLLTRDAKRYRSYFPDVPLITP